MTFISGNLCNLRVLQESEEEVRIWTAGVMGNLDLRYMATGSIPMRYIDAKEVWKKEREAGAVQFGIWLREKRTYPPYENEEVYDEWMVGTCGLHAHKDIYRSWEFRILIFDPDAIGNGIGTEATKLTVDYCFARLNAHRCWLGVHADNIGAIKCYKKVGFKEEGRLREDLYAYGKYADAILYGILEGEWRELCKSSTPETGR